MQTHQLRVVALAAATLVASGAAAPAADHLLSGTVASAAGEKLGGVTVSAKAHGSTITTSVYTDEQGGYYFPPLPAGTYTVWAQALAFEPAKGEVELTAARRADSAAAARIKRVFRNACTGCHTPSYVLQFRFDEDGWSKIIDLMKLVPNTGVLPATPKPNAIIDFHQKELAAYLARARGPGESSLKITPRPRPAGEAARVVWTLYDLPMVPDAGIGTTYQTNDGTD